MQRAKQFQSFQEAFAPGSYEIWYSRTDFFRDASMGYEWMWERHHLPMNQANLEQNWVKLGTMMPAKLEDIFYHLQGEKWSPNGEAYDFISKSGTSHTSMCVGDIIKDGNKLHICDRFGFVSLDWSPAPSHCKVCGAEILVPELCASCAEGNDPFPAASKFRPQ